MTATPPVDGRTRHYGDFYGVGDATAGDDRPVLVVHGNCQAEAMRVVLETSTHTFRCVRVPPVHELVAGDEPHLTRLLRTCAVLVSQPVRDGYHGLPLGTAEVAAAAPAARLVLVPVVRDSRLHPYQALVRVDGAGEPPVVPYHDLRTLALAARTAAPAGSARGGAGASEAPRTAGRAGLLAVADRSRAELRRREAAHGTLVVSDLLEAAGAEASHTLNHPGNPVLVGLVQRVLDALGAGATARDPGRVLLRSVLAPLHPEVLDALGLDPARARPDWLVNGEPVTDRAVREAQLAWYAEHPEVVTAGLARHADAMRDLGL
ncbi:WcbI family polysaccharide biosynthesis putative acetyltransferase [Aquipuribacter sp. SD81]|uniref:WcbI family polysaccharide biosynthesis putative acetyltransferase n=1 Tax=Aquipuribacter sp. SD81 TaxID=3127703 RepID=UPI00301684D9